jgi:hypothetical protein
MRTLLCMLITVAFTAAASAQTTITAPAATTRAATLSAPAPAQVQPLSTSATLTTVIPTVIAGGAQVAIPRPSNQEIIVPRPVPPMPRTGP